MDPIKKDTLSLYMNIISRNVRKLRGILTQADFAKKVGVSRTSIHRIESRMNFKVDSLLRIALACGIPPHELCMTEEERQRLQFRTDILIASLKEVLKDVLKNDVIEKLKA